MGAIIILLVRDDGDLNQVGYNTVDEVRFWTYLKVKAIELDVVCERKKDCERSRFRG